MNEISLLEIESEIAAGTRGSSLGIRALKIASLNKKSNLFKKYQSLQIKDANNCLWDEVSTPTAIRIEGLVEVYKNVSKAVSAELTKRKFPLVLAADHGSAGGTIAGIKMAKPDKTIGVIWIDAHGDLHSPYTSPSGNMHGMPLAISLAINNEEKQVNTVKDITLQKWNELKSMGGIVPKILPENLVFFGVRDTEEPEEYLMQKHHIKNFTVEESRAKGMEKVANDALERLSNCDYIYISFDVDSMDPDKVSYGTGTPVKNGYYPDEIKKLLQTLFKSDKIIAFEMVEINPTLDNKCNLMAETAFEILEETVNLIENK